MGHKKIKTDFLIVGGGAAGLNAALHASHHGEVVLLTKSSLQTSSSYWAQGGIAAVLGPPDSYRQHKSDTMKAGRGLCNEEAVDLLVEEGAAEIKRLIKAGMPFDKDGDSWDLSLEGGHSNRRVLHADGAATGRALVDFLAQKVDGQKNITVIDQAFVFELIDNDRHVTGAHAYHYANDQLLRVDAAATILATGGYAGLFEQSTNPHTSTGDGLWLAYEAGAKLRDLEFVQFHPTAFFDPERGSFLISEAVRGEGARLYNQQGERFLADIEGQELAPRDVVAREIFDQIQNQQADFVYLDVRHLDAEKLQSHFPNLCSRIENRGVDMAHEGIPVVPAAHYCIGGIATDLQGQTSLAGLYACGEVAATGVHGANRLASNSLLECLVFSRRAVEDASNMDLNQAISEDSNFSIAPTHENRFLALKQKVASILSQNVGISRSEDKLKEAREALKKLPGNDLSNEQEYFVMRTAGLLKLAQLITRSALKREESRGVHYRRDFPESVKGVDRIEHQKSISEFMIS